MEKSVSIIFNVIFACDDYRISEAHKVAVVSSKDNVADVFTKHGVNTDLILNVVQTGMLNL